MKIHSKRGVWCVTEPEHPVKRFDSEEAAIAYVNGEDPVMDADIDDDEYYDE